ncbi:hypothetical protein BMF94_6553 [Rhodotorula taiwanensis]|uniref:Major facilitator superfamily (MFS) profile domain-containing protein n=1 Tax=Rhodotorula taiwanensis TaxID=741276 RepID=A0A2S5B163_9BASI|nr:hypothetical protein BMF94_6553 [Rhodotorula taiwanensis]
MASLASTTSIDKESKNGFAPVSALKPVDSILPTVSEDAEDEAMKIVGHERNEVTEAEMKAVTKKIDRRVLPLLAAVYFSQFFDKNSLSYSSVMGLPLAKNNDQYSLVASAFYIGFMIFEIPSSTLAQRFPLAKYLGVNVLLWATFLILHAASANFGFFFAMRFLLGTFECCVSPILISMIAAWYPRHMQARRISVFYMMNGLTNMLGGICAYGVTFYKGTAIAHWRIFYVLMGGLAYVVGIAVLVWLPDSPATAKFLTEREKLVTLEQVRDNHSGTKQNKFKPKHAKEALLDPKTWLLILLTFLSSVPNGGLSSYSSLLIKSFGFNSRETLLLQIPRGLIAAITTVTVCFLSDRFQRRMLPIFVAVIPTVIGAALMVAMPHSKGGSLAGIFMAETYGSSLALLYAWTTTNTASFTKKTVTNAMFITCFGLANVIGTFIFNKHDKPDYLPGKIAVLTLFALMLPTVSGMHFYTTYLNKKKATKLAALVEEKGWTPSDVERERDRAAFMDLTDRENPYFRYMS